MLRETIKAVNALGFYFDLGQHRSGKWSWSASALGDNVEMGPNGALYTRAIAFGNTPEEAMTGLIVELEKRKAERAAPPPEEDYSDLV